MKTFFLVVLCSIPCLLSGLDFWQHPEGADLYSLFLDIKATELSFKSGFTYYNPEIAADFLPFPLPFSIGAYFKIPDPNLKSFGVRTGYHLNLDDEKFDFYVLYVFDFGFTRNTLLEQYGDQRQERQMYDFRIGARYIFGKFVCLVIETDFKLRGITAGVSLKLN